MPSTAARSLLRAALLAGLAIPSVAQAQTAAEAGTTDDIVVTAQKREQNLLEVPLSIQAFTGAALEASGSREINDLLDSIPGASSVSRTAPGFETIQIRGIASGTTGDATVGYYVDDVPFSIPNLQLAPPARLFDLQRVEVLRGPQGTLYGQGAMGGTIRMVTAPANPNEMELRGQLEVSSTKGGEANYAGDGVVNIPIVKDLIGLRITGGYERMGGFADSNTLNRENINDSVSWNLRGKLRIQPADDVTIDFTAWHVDNSLDFRNTMDSVDPPLIDTVATDGRPNFIDTRLNLFAAVVNADLGFATVTSSTSYIDHILDFDASFLSIPGFGTGVLRNESTFKTKSFTQEVRFADTSDGPFGWIVGGYFSSSKIDSQICLSLLLPCTIPFSVNINSEGNIKSDAFAVFGELSYAFMDDRLVATVGGRYFADDRRTSGIDFNTGQFNAQSDVFRTFNPRFNLSFNATEDFLIFANIAKGFRSGSFQTQAQADSAAAVGVPVGTSIDPDSVWSYELGAKGRIFGGSLLLDTAIYQIDWSNIQLQSTISGVATLSNGGDARVRGVDLGLTWRTPIEGLSLSFVGNYNDAVFTEVLPQLVAINPLAAPGERIPSVPETGFQVSGDWSFPLGDGLTGNLNAAYSYRDLILDSSGLASDRVEELNIRAGIDLGDFKLQIFADNLLDNRVAVVAGPLGVQPNVPRRIGGRVSFEF
jgi:outer membrane receptor protein involved in Fe transport